MRFKEVIKELIQIANSVNSRIPWVCGIFIVLPAGHSYRYKKSQCEFLKATGGTGHSYRYEESRSVRLKEIMGMGHSYRYKRSQFECSTKNEGVQGIAIATKSPRLNFLKRDG